MMLTANTHFDGNATIKTKILKRNQILIDNRLSGVQSCNEERANVFVHFNDSVHYVRIDRLSKKVEFRERANVGCREAEKFVEDNFEQFDQFCSTL